MADLVKLEQNMDRYLSMRNTFSSFEQKELEALMKDCSLILGSDAGNSLKSICMSILYHIAFLGRMSLRECWQIYWNLNRALFLNHNLWLVDGELDILYRYIYQTVDRSMDYSNKMFKQACTRDQNKVVMITSQFLGVGHAPTTRVLDYSYTLQKYLGKKVVIINDAGMNYEAFPYLDGGVCFNFAKEYGGKEVINYKDEAFEFLQVGTKMPDISILQALLDLVYDINPLFVYQIGGSGLAADLCSRFVTVASQACSFQIPISEAQFLLVGRKLEQKDEPRLNRLSSGQRVIETNFNYLFRESSIEYSRRQFSIPPDVFLISVVGNRLDDEINGDFLALMKRLLQETQIQLVLIGPMKRQDEIYFTLGDGARERVHFTGSLTDASELIRHTDLNINPDRSGGGRAAFEALYYGVPTLSLRKGDAYYVGGFEFGADHYEDMFLKISKYAQDPYFYSKRKLIAKERAGILSDMKGTQEKLLSDLFAKEANRFKRNEVLK